MKLRDRITFGALLTSAMFSVVWAGVQAWRAAKALF